MNRGGWDEVNKVTQQEAVILESDTERRAVD